MAARRRVWLISPRRPPSARLMPTARGARVCGRVDSRLNYWGEGCQPRKDRPGFVAPAHECIAGREGTIGRYECRDLLEGDAQRRQRIVEPMVDNMSQANPA